ncbi:MAG: hypothetical protein LQ350_002477 [Teloschistes chrysophthalmus]|nr:MAG: hypothetical protein LQ350_002477 [Niorma chrysophthalma]
MFNFTPLLGARSPPSAPQSLLELDGGVKVLIDVGWDEHFTVSKLEALERHVPSLSIILLTHATPSHLGAFAHCCKNIPLFAQIPIYATTPVISLGRTLLQDIYSSTPLASTVIPADSLAESSYASGSSSSDPTPQLLREPPTSDEIAHYFSLIHSLKYSQPHEPLPSAFSPPLNGLKITAYNAGHTLGGTIWHLQHGMESIVYAVDWNQVRENVFGGAAWLDASGGGAEVIEQLRKPTALICSSRGAEKSALTGGRKKRDEMLLDTIRATVAKGGTVLIPTDTSARVLELAYLLEHAWRKEHSNNSSDSPFKSAKLYLASRNVGATMRYARSMLEWMDENIAKELEADEASTNRKQHKRNDSKQIGNRDNQPAGKTDGPFEFKYLRLLERKKQIDKILSRPGARVILASDSSLEWGFSKEIFHRIAGDNSNLIVLTENKAMLNGSNNDGTSLGSLLWSWYQEKRDGVAIETGADGQNLEQVHSGGRELQTGFAARIALEGRELLAYQQYLATQRRSQTQATLANGATLESAADAVDEASSTSSSSSEESDPDRQGKALNTSAKVANLNRTKTGLDKETVGVNILLRQPGVYDYDVRGKKGREQMFPFVSRRRRADDFGDIIRPDEYLRAEERDEVDGHDMRDGVSGKENKLGQKRKWGEAGLKDDDGEPGSSIANKRRQQRPTATDRNGTTNGDVALTDQLDRELDELSDSSDSEAAEGVNGPSKLVFHQHSINAHIKIAFVDFAGIHDQRSLSMLIPLIQPRKLILISGSASETSYLANECRQKLVPMASESTVKAEADVYTPIDGETVNASVDTNAWTVKLSSGLVKRLHWQNVRGLGVVTLMGHLAAMEVDQHDAADSISKKRQKLLKDDDGEESKARQTRLDDKAQRFDPVLDVLPASIAAATRSVAQPLHVGDLRLADLRKMLQSTGHTAEFRGEGTLLIDGLVAVRKTATGRIEVEGGGFGAPNYPVKHAEGSFHAVKRRIYDGLAVIAGG